MKKFIYLISLSIIVMLMSSCKTTTQPNAVPTEAVDSISVPVDTIVVDSLK